MKTLFLNTLIVIFLLSVVPMDAQPPLHMNKRLERMKQRKLCETLELENDRKEEFKALYKSENQKLHDHFKKLRKEVMKLKEMVKKNASDEDLKKQNLVILNLHADMDKIRIERMKKFQEFLSVEEFSKFLLFEEFFFERVNKKLHHFRKGKGKDRKKDRDRDKDRGDDEAPDDSIFD